MPQLTTINQTRTPAASLMSYETGRLDWRQTLIFAGAGLVALAFAFLPLQLAAALWPDPYETTMSGYRTVALAGSTLLGCVLVFGGLYMLALPLVRERAHHARVQLAFEQDLASRAAGNDVVVETEMSVYDFDTDNFLHMLGLVVMIWFLNKERRGNAPWAVRNMMGNLMIGRVGTGLTISEGEARQARKLIGVMGIVQDDGIDKSAGRLAPQTLEEAVRLLSDKWNRIPVERE